MRIIDSIQNYKSQGMTDEQILNKVIKEYPEKEKVLNEALKRKISAARIIQEIIKQNSQPEKNEPEEKNTENAQSRTIEEAKKRIEQLKEKIPEIEEGAPPESGEKTQQKNKEEVLDEFLKRKIASEKEYYEPEAEESRAERVPTEMIKPLPRKKGGLSRLVIRFAIFGFFITAVAGIAGFWYWSFVLQPQQNKNCLANSDCKNGFFCVSGACSETECSSDENCQNNFHCEQNKCVQNQNLSASIPLFQTEDAKVIEIGNLAEIKTILSQETPKFLNADQFRRIVFVDKATNKEIELKDFFSALGAKANDDFFQRLSGYFTFFIYSQSQGNRIGFAIKINDYTGFAAILKSKEPALQEDFLPLFNLITTTPLLTGKTFKDATAVSSYSGPNFRYKVLINNNDLGFYYLSSSKDYFIFATSWQSMEKVIGKLNITADKINK